MIQVPAKSVTDYIHFDIQKHLHYLMKIANLLEQVLDVQLQPYIRVANLKGDCLIVETTSAVWATALRYRIPTLLTKLQQYAELSHLRKIDYYIQPDSQPVPIISQPLPRLSKATATILHKLADSIMDTKLQDVLHKIANHH